MKQFIFTLFICISILLGSVLFAQAETQIAINNAPDNPEKVSVSTGISVSDFFENFRQTVKYGGLHSVAIDEKARRSAVKISVDDDIELLAFYTEKNNSKIISWFNFQLIFENTRQQEDAKVILHDFLSTLGTYFDFSITREQSDDIMEIGMDGNSCVFSDLLIYGSARYGAETTELTLRVFYSGKGYVPEETTTFSQTSEREFRALVDDLKQEGVIPASSGDFRFHEDYQNEWAQINWYQWESFDRAENFVISTDISWKSASNTPNYPYSGCGFVLRSSDESNHLYASMNMDGKIHFGGIRNGIRLSYGDFNYGTHSTSETAQLVLVVSGDVMTAYVNGARIGQQRNLAFTAEGDLAFTLMSGTNRDFGTRCIFRNIYYYVW